MYNSLADTMQPLLAKKHFGTCQKLKEINKTFITSVELWVFSLVGLGLYRIITSLYLRQVQDV